MLRLDLDSSYVTVVIIDESESTSRMSLKLAFHKLNT